MAKYSNTSPYFETREIADYLDVLNPRTITAEQDDQSYTIERTYAYRPDLLAYDLYGSPRLWWVFAQRNPDQLEDPIYDIRFQTRSDCAVAKEREPAQRPRDIIHVNKL